MRRGEKPEGYRQMRPKTFPVSNYNGNSQQMLQEIRNSLRNLTKPSDLPKGDTGGPGKMAPEDPRQQGRSGNLKNQYQKALQEIRKSLVPYKVNGSGDEESTTSGADGNKSQDQSGFEEVRGMRLVFLDNWIPFCTYLCG